MAANPPASARYDISFQAIGTAWTISLYGQLDTAELERLQSAIHQRIDSYDKNYSRFRDDSLVTAMSHRAGDYQLPADAEPLFDTYRTMYDLTGGVMTPLIGGLLSEAGYDAGYSLQPHADGRNFKPVPAWDEALEYAYPKLTIKQACLLDLGAAGKGYLVDLLAQLLEAHHIEAYCIDAGGDIRQRGVPADDDRIGLEHPSAEGQAIGVVSLGNRALCGSAANRRRWASGRAADGGDLHHIMDARSRQPVRGIAALWTVADSGLVADALSTALFFTTPQRLNRVYNFEYAILRDSPQGPQLEHSAGFPAEFFTN